MLPRISSLARAAITLVASESAGPPWGGLYLNPPSWGGLCEGVTTIPSASPAPVVRPWLARRIAWLTAGVGREAVAVVDQHRDVVGDQHLQRRGPGGLGQGVGVATDEQRAVVALLLAVVADRLRGRGDVHLVEGGGERGAAVAARAEGDLLGDVVGIGLEVEVGRHEVGDVHQVLGAGGLSGSLVGGHGPILAVMPWVGKTPVETGPRVRAGRAGGCRFGQGSVRQSGEVAALRPATSEEDDTR